MIINWHCDEEGANSIAISPNYTRGTIRLSIDEHGGQLNIVELDLDDANELSQMMEMLIEKIEEFEEGKL